MKIYKLDLNRVFTGEIQDIASNDPCPHGWTREDLSSYVAEQQAGKFVVVNGGFVVVLNQYPPPSCETKTKIKQQELKDLLVTYKENQLNLQLSWLSATVVDGAAGESKKAAIQQQITYLKNKYNADVAAIVAKYS